MTQQKPPAATDQLADQAQTEAEEIKADIAETKEEVAEARAEGDTARADRLESRVGTLESKLDTVLDKLTKLVERPFHPAPEEHTAAPADTAPDNQGTGDGAADATDDGAAAARPRGRRPSRRFFGTRADYDD